MNKRINWKGEILPLAARWVEAQEVAPTLRQTFYWLVSKQRIPNTEKAYKGLSNATARERRNGTFPPFTDGTREIHLQKSWDTIEDFLVEKHGEFMLDRWEGQPWLPVIAVEKRGMVQQMKAWYGSLGFPIVPSAGYASQTLTDDLSALVREDGRPAVLLYLGDFDASGLDIERDFIKRTACWDRTQRVALSMEQIEQYGLPMNPGKDSDRRHARFKVLHGDIQVEVDALEPEVVKDLVLDALLDVADFNLIQERLDAEQEMRAALAERLWPGE